MTSYSTLGVALSSVWAMEERALSSLLTIAAREHDITPEVLEAYRAKALANAEQATVRDGVAIISANGPLFKRANLLTALSGASSYEIMRRDLQAAVDAGNLKGAILNLDTPGGEANGANELAAYVYSLRGKFPVVAYVNGMAASAGYWIASAAQEIVVDATAILGSIGVQMAMRKSDDPKGSKTYRFVSSQSPMKNADPGTDAGARHIQSIVDAMAQVFVSAVATHRGRSIETVLSDFGKGGIFVGQDAVKAGLADRVGSFEGALAELSTGRAHPSKERPMTNAYSNPVIDAAVAAAVAQADARTAQINQIGASLSVSPAEISSAIAAGTDPAAFAIEHSRKFAAARAAAAAPSAAMSEDEEIEAWAQAIANCDDPSFRDQRLRLEATSRQLSAHEEAEIDALVARIVAA